MAQAYALSERTARRLQALLGEGVGTSGGAGVGAGTRQVGYVLITSKAAPGEYVGTVQAWNELDGGWESYAADAVVLTSNDVQELAVGWRYVAIRYGDRPTGESVWVADIALATGCGLWTNDDGELAFYAPDVAGCGLTYEGETYCGLTVYTPDMAGCGLRAPDDCTLQVYAPDIAGCGLRAVSDCQLGVKAADIAGQGLNASPDGCQLYIDPGCGIALEGGKKVGVHAGTLAGAGLTTEGTCSLAVNPGCGIAVADDRVKVYTPDMAGNGLNHDTTYCQLYIEPGCGITLEGGKKVGVHAGTLAGSGLTTEGTCSLAVNPGTCLAIVGDTVAVDLTPQFGPTFSAITNVGLSGNCYGVYLNWAVTPFTFVTNPCGLFQGFAAGVPAVGTSYVPLGCCCPQTPTATEITVAAMSEPVVLAQAVEDASKADAVPVWNRTDWLTPKPLPPLEGVVPTSKFAVITCAVGEKGRQLLEVSEPSIRAYAKRIGADYNVIRGDVPLNPLYPFEDKFRIGQYLEHYDRIVYIDADIIVPPDAPNLLELVPANAVGAHDDLPHNTGGFAWYFTEVEAVQRWQKLPLRSPPWMLNTGLIVASKEHRAIFDPPQYPYQAVHCFEQHLIGIRVHQAGIPVFLMPTKLHWQWWLDKGKQIYPDGQFIHFAGLQDHPKRLELMRQAVEDFAVPRSGNKKGCGCGKKVRPLS